MELIYSYTFEDWSYESYEDVNAPMSLLASSLLGHPGRSVSNFVASLFMNWFDSNNPSRSNSFDSCEDYDCSINSDIDQSDILLLMTTIHQENPDSYLRTFTLPINADEVQSVYEYISKFELESGIIKIDYENPDLVIDDDNYISFSFFCDDDLTSNEDKTISAKIDIWNDDTKDAQFIDFFIENTLNNCDSLKKMEVKITYRE